MIDHLCRSGHRCANMIDGHPRETAAPGTFCDACTTRTRTRIARLPEQFLRLHSILGDRHAGVDAGMICKPKPGSVIPMNLHVDTLLGRIEDTATLAAEVLADDMGMRNPDYYPAARQVAVCAGIIAPNIARLMGITEIETMFWIPAGTGFGVTVTNGVDIIIRLDALSTLAHYTLGWTRARSQRDLPCTRCQAQTIGRWAGSDDFDCTNCGSRFPEDDIRRQDKILLALCKRGLIPA